MMLERVMRLGIGSGLIFLLGMAAAGKANGEVFTFSQLPPPDPQASASYGWSVALSPGGDHAIVGARGQGRAYVFSRTSGGTWTLDSKLPVVSFSEEGFGHDVALSGDGRIALVAHPNARCPGAPPSPIPPPFYCGAAFVFVRQAGGWIQEARFGIETVSDFNFSFGVSVALSEDGSTALIGQLGNCPEGSCIGAVFAFQRSAGGTWSSEGTLRPANPKARSFGGSLDLSADGNMALIGAWGTFCGASVTCGSAHVFTRSGGVWSEQAELTPSDPHTLARFGTAALAADGMSALIGAPGEASAIDSPPGAVYAFAQSGGVWTEVQKISGGSGGDQFGSAVSLSADGLSALVGAFSTDCNRGNDNCGAVYRLARQGKTWGQPQYLRSFFAGARKGYSVALSSDGGTGLAGAPGRNCPAGTACGTVFSLNALPPSAAVGLAAAGASSWFTPPIRASSQLAESVQSVSRKVSRKKPKWPIAGSPASRGSTCRWVTGAFGYSRSRISTARRGA